MKNPDHVPAHHKIASAVHIRGVQRRSRCAAAGLTDQNAFAQRADEGSAVDLLDRQTSPAGAAAHPLIRAGRGERKILIRLEPLLVPVLPTAKRAHQGWRYLAAEDAPADLDGADADEEDDGLWLLPPKLSDRLSRLALI